MIRRCDGRRKLTSRMRGVTLVELVMFIAISAFVMSAMLQAFSGTMRGSHYGKAQTQASEVGQQRMEVILGQRERLGFSGLDATTFDPCDGVGASWGAVAVCQSGSYQIVSQFDNANNACGIGTGTSCVVVALTVTGPNNDVLTRLTQHIWNY